MVLQDVRKVFVLFLLRIRSLLIFVLCFGTNPIITVFNDRRTVVRKILSSLFPDQFSLLRFWLIECTRLFLKVQTSMHIYICISIPRKKWMTWRNTGLRPTSIFECKKREQLKLMSSLSENLLQSILTNETDDEIFIPLHLILSNLLDTFWGFDHSILV